MGKYYIYRHIRLDKNEVFYIGFGTKPKKYNLWTTEYGRAYKSSRFDRSVWWHKINKITEIQIDILFESDDYSVAEQKEIEFIALYGRADKGLGTLVNHTDGGKGTTSCIVSPEIRAKRLKNLFLPKKTKVIFIYSNKGIFIKRFNSFKEAAIELNINEMTLRNYMPNRNKTSDSKYRVFYEFLGEIIDCLPNRDLGAGKRKKIKQLDALGNVVKVYNSVVEAAKELNCFDTSIRKALNGNRKKYKGYYWTFYED